MSTHSDVLIPVTSPSITHREGELAKEAALNAWGPDHYRYNRLFEDNFADYIDSEYAASLPHATAALHLALTALDIGPGDEVIVPAITWIASVAPVIYTGARPVFVDIDPETWCIDVASIPNAITPKTKAIIGVDLYGSMCDWPQLKQISLKYGLALIEDSAEALGSSLNKKRAGSWGDIAAFSFHGSKTLTTGEGGMLVTSNAKLFERVQTLRDHGRPPGDKFFQNSEIGYKYKMSAVQAALGLAQLERVEYLIEQKKKIFSWYFDRLNENLGVKLNAQPNGVQNSYWMVTAIPDISYKVDKFALMSHLRTRNIDSRPFFSPLNSLKAFENYQDANRFLPNQLAGQHASNCGVNLPSGYDLTEEVVDMICQAFKEILQNK